MKKLLFIFLSVCGAIMASCDSKSSTETLQDELRMDSFREVASKKVDADLAKTLMDTAGVWMSPIKVISAEVVQKEYSSFKSIRIDYKNVSKKTVDAVRFKWYGLNAFGEPADMGTAFPIRGFGGGYSDDPIKPGEKTWGVWDVLSRDAKKVIIAWPYEVVLSDGSKWKLN